ncbi:MAG: Asp/Glu racemase [Saprospiraceae bacterium]|nr:Asp/Glu racemase [Saprospiraceae bacterium]
MKTPSYAARPAAPIRIGMIVPSSNVTMEKEVPRMLRRRESAFVEKFSFHGSRVRMKHVDPESLFAMNTQAERAILELADASVDAVLYACLVAIMVEGPGAHRRIEAKLEQTLQAEGRPAPVVTSAGALVDTLHDLDAGRIALLAPYLPALTNKVCRYLSDEGIEVVSAQSLSVADNEAVGKLDPDNLLRLLDNIPGNVNAIVLSACVQMPSLGMIAEAERLTGIRVVTAASATVFQTLKKLGLPPAIEGFGSLLQGVGLFELSH